MYFSSLNASGNHVPIIRRNYYIYVTMVFVNLFGWSDKYQCRIDTVISPDDGSMVAETSRKEK